MVETTFKRNKERKEREKRIEITYAGVEGNSRTIYANFIDTIKMLERHKKTA